MIDGAEHITISEQRTYMALAVACALMALDDCVRTQCARGGLGRAGTLVTLCGRDTARLPPALGGAVLVSVLVRHIKPFMKVLGP